MVWTPFGLSTTWSTEEALVSLETVTPWLISCTYWLFSPGVVSGLFCPSVFDTISPLLDKPPSWALVLAVWSWGSRPFCSVPGAPSIAPSEFGSLRPPSWGTALSCGISACLSCSGVLSADRSPSDKPPWGSLVARSPVGSDATGGSPPILSSPPPSVGGVVGSSGGTDPGPGSWSTPS